MKDSDEIRELLGNMTLEEKAGLCSGRDFWRTKAVERLGIPNMMMCDGPHGLRKQVGEEDHLGINESIETVCFPTAAALASSYDAALLRELGETLGKQCQAENVAMLLGPGLNIKRSPLCGRNFEYFSEDPFLAGQLGTAYIQGLQSQGVAACCKHFAANNQETARASGSSQVEERTLREIYLPAFETAVKEGGVRSVMCSYNQINGTFASENKKLLTDILRDEWGYHGFVVTDWGAVKDQVKGILAGLDLEMPGGPGNQDKKIVAAVRSGALPEKKLDEAAGNVLRFVLEARAQQRKETYCVEEDLKKAARMESECAVLLKNNGILPIQIGKKVAFIGEFAEKPRYQGSGSSRIHSRRVISAREAAPADVVFAQGYHSAETEEDLTLWEEAMALAQNADIAVIFAGLPDSFESEGYDRTTMAMPENQNRLIQAVSEVQPNTVVVLHAGAPVEMPWAERTAAILNLYLGGDGVGQAAVDILYGTVNPSGKLAETYPRKLADNPSFLNFPGEKGIVSYHEGIYVGYRYYDKKQMDVLFPFGHGLSYTTFAYRDIQADKLRFADTDTVTVSCRVKNTGSVFGKEAVQLYVRDVYSLVGRPVRELKAFAKVALEPGEEKQVSFTLDKRAFAYYETEIHDWLVESGEFVIEIGASSRDIRQSITVFVEGTRELPVVYTRMSTLGDLLKTQRGREILKMLKPEPSDEEKKADPLGAGNAEAAHLDIPLTFAVSLGRITEEQLADILKELNE